MGSRYWHDGETAVSPWSLAEADASRTVSSWRGASSLDLLDLSSRSEVARVLVPTIDSQLESNETNQIGTSERLRKNHDVQTRCIGLDPPLGISRH